MHVAVQCAGFGLAHSTAVPGAHWPAVQVSSPLHALPSSHSEASLHAFAASPPSLVAVPPKPSGLASLVVAQVRVSAQSGEEPHPCAVAASKSDAAIESGIVTKNEVRM